MDLRDPGCRGVYLTRYFWPAFPAFAAAFLRDGGDFFDVGANFGLITFGTLPHSPNTRFHLFEANPRIIPLLERSARDHAGAAVVVNHCCVTDVPGTSHLHLHNNDTAYGYISGQGTPVPNLLLDEYVARRGIGRIGFLKMDIEGWELHALRGGRQELTAGTVRAGFVEVSPVALGRAGATAQGLLDLLAELGFDCYFVEMLDAPDPHGLTWARVRINGTTIRVARASPIPPTFVQGDVFILHRTNLHAATVRAALES